MSGMKNKKKAGKSDIDQIAGESDRDGIRNAIKTELLGLAEEKYRVFSSGLIPNATNVLGIRLPLLRKLAARIAKGDWRAYLKSADSEYFEEVMLQGMVIGYAKTGLEEKLRHVAAFLPKIGNWSVCDSFCSGLKVAGEKREQVWEFLQPYLDSDREYDIRFGVVMLLMYYIDEEYIDRILLKLGNIRHEGYYAKMAVAWAASMCFARFPEPTMQFLADSTLDDFTFNKTLQKIIESNQVDRETKDRIRKMKRKPDDSQETTGR